MGDAAYRGWKGTAVTTATVMMVLLGAGLAHAEEGEGQLQRNVTDTTTSTSTSAETAPGSRPNVGPQTEAPVGPADPGPSGGQGGSGGTPRVAAQQPTSVGQRNDAGMSAPDAVSPQEYEDMNVPAGAERAACAGGAVGSDGVCEGAETVGGGVAAEVAADLGGEQEGQPGRAGRPAQTVTVVTVEEIVQRAKAKLKLPKPKIGSAPCTDAECEGTVGVPTWFWLEDDQWKTQSDSATAGRKSVTIKAKPSKVTWSLGDGQSVSCSGPGTPFDTSKGSSASPDCGIEQGYQSAGTYTLTATITYDIAITAATEETETFTTSSSEQVSIGEAQVIVGQSGR